MNQGTRVEYFLTLVLCALWLGILRPELASILLTLMGALLPASFKVRTFLKKMHTRRYRFSTVGVLYGLEKTIRKGARFIHKRYSLILAPHLLSLTLALGFRFLTQSGSLVYWLVGALIFELSFHFRPWLQRAYK